MDFKQIEAFVNVVRYKSFSKAADASFFTQPTISTHIQNLEKELGVKLLDRKSRSVEMTLQGEKFYKYAIEMINARAQAVDAIKSSYESIDGVLEIQSSSIPGVTFLPAFLAEFREKYDSVQFYVSLSDTQSVIENILDRRGEIGFVGDIVKHTSIRSTLVNTDKSVLIAPLSYNMNKKISLKEAFEYPFIWRETGSATRKNFEIAASERGLDYGKMKFAALIDDLNGIIRSVESGLGVSIISEKVADGLQGRVSVSEISDFDETRSFYMITLKSGSLSPAANAFVKFVESKSR